MILIKMVKEILIKLLYMLDKFDKWSSNIAGKFIQKDYFRIGFFINILSLIFIRVLYNIISITLTLICSFKYIWNNKKYLKEFKKMQHLLIIVVFFNIIGYLLSPWIIILILWFTLFYILTIRWIKLTKKEYTILFILRYFNNYLTDKVLKIKKEIRLKLTKLRND